MRELWREMVFQKIGVSLRGGLSCLGLPLPFIPLPCSFGLKNRGLCKRCTIGEIHLHHPFGTRQIGSNDSVFLGGKIYAIALVCTLSRIIVMEVCGSGKWPYLKGNYYWRGLFFNFHDHGRKGMVWKDIWYLLLAMIFSCVNCNDRFRPTSGFPRCSYLVTVIL